MIGPGKTFGEMSLIDGEPRSASAIALDDSKVLVLTEMVLLKLAQLMSQRLRQTSDLLVDFLGG
jgi:CRP-like cAMP-binding protein